MAVSSKDQLIPFGNLIVSAAQWLCAAACGLLVLIVPVVVLRSQGVFAGSIDSDAIAASPLSIVAILVLLAAIAAALFLFFGKLRAIIASTGEGDPFTPVNAQRLRAMAWLFLGAKILSLVVAVLRLRVANLVNSGATGGDTLDFRIYDLDAVLIVIVLFILARIFDRGAAMRDDLQGTI